MTERLQSSFCRSCLAASLLIVSASIEAQTMQVPRHSTVSVPIAMTAAEQMQAAIAAYNRMRPERDPQRRYDALTATIMNLEIIPVRWPSDINAVLQSGVMLADVTISERIPGKAIAALTGIESRASGTPYETGVERRLGLAYEMNGDIRKAAQHLALAEKSLSANSSFAEAEATFFDTARFYERRNQPREAIKRYVRIAEYPAVLTTTRVVARLAALKAAVSIADDPDHNEARAASAALDEEIHKARSKQLTPADATTIDHVAADAKRLRQEHRLR